MNRRTFLKTIIGAVLTGAIAPTTLLKNLPDIGKATLGSTVSRQTVGNRLLTPDMIAREALKQLEQHLAMDGHYIKNSTNINTIKIRRPRL